MLKHEASILNRFAFIGGCDSPLIVSPQKEDAQVKKQVET